MATPALEAWDQDVSEGGKNETGVQFRISHQMGPGSDCIARFATIDHHGTIVHNVPYNLLLWY